MVLKKRSSAFGKISGTAWEYIFQFFMLFLAVTAGFFAENFREQQAERKQSGEYGQTMVRELVMDTMNLTYHISMINANVKNIGALAAYVRSKPVDQMTNVELYRLTRIESNPPFRWSLATLDQIRNSGRLQYFTNDSIVFYISMYSSWTLHLNQDNAEDLKSFRYATELRNRIVNSNYTKQEKDEIMKVTEFEVNTVNYEAPPLSSNSKEIHELVNAYLTAGDLSAGHVKELANVVADHRRLIRLLKREYKLK